MVVALTLVPATLAQSGYAFTYQGPNLGEECKGCPFQKLCFGLEPGRHYEVTAVRKVIHPCNLHEEGKVQVVEVQEIPVTTTLEVRHLRGTAAKWAPIPCKRPECVNWHLCNPRVPAGAYAIAEVGETVACPAGFELQRVKLQPR